LRKKGVKTKKTQKLISSVVAVIFFVRFFFLSIFVRFAENFVRSNVSSATK
jgi:hypothetical protein